MVLVELRYHGKVKSYSVPETWNELTKNQLLTFCRYANALGTPEQARVVLLNKMIGIPPVAIARLLDDVAGRTKLAQLTGLLNFLYEENTPGGAPLTKNLQPVLRCRYKQRTWYGPADDFLNLRWNEFMVADQYHTVYVRTREERHLDYLVATLYRPQRPGHKPDSPDYQGDRREDFNQHLLDRRVRTMARVSTPKKLAAYYFYVGCRSQLVRDYPDIFEGDGQRGAAPREAAPGEAAGQSGGPPRGQTSDWLDLLRNLPSDKFGTLEQLETQHVHATLELASRMMRDAKKIRTGSPGDTK